MSNIQLDWEPTQDGKGSYVVVGDYRLVVKKQDHGSPNWWWGIYEDTYDDPVEQGYEPDEAAAKEAAEDVGLLL